MGYYFFGTVEQDDFPVSRTIRAHSALDGAVLGETVSTSGTGEFTLRTTYSGAHYLVCMDEYDFGVSYNDLIYGNVYPEDTYLFKDEFTAEDGSNPNNEYWSLSGPGSGDISIVNNRVRMTGTSYALCSFNFKVTGNFDAQVELDAVDAPNTNSWSLSLRAVKSDSSDLVMATRRYSGNNHVFTAERYISSSWTTVDLDYDTKTLGKLRIKRTGSLFEFYYMVDSSWISLSSYSGWNDDVVLQLEHGPWDSPSTFTGDFDNFIINDGEFV